LEILSYFTLHCSFSGAVGDYGFSFSDQGTGRKKKNLNHLRSCCKTFILPHALDLNFVLNTWAVWCCRPHG